MQAYQLEFRLLSLLTEEGYDILLVLELGRVVQVTQNAIRAFVGLICSQIWCVRWYSYQYFTNSFSPFSYLSSHCAKLHTLHVFYALSSFYLHNGNFLSYSVLLVFANLKLASMFSIKKIAVIAIIIITLIQKGFKTLIKSDIFLKLIVWWHRMLILRIFKQHIFIHLNCIFKNSVTKLFWNPQKYYLLDILLWFHIPLR